MVQEFGGKVRFAEENYGDSELAARFGVKRYPAIFVGDVLVATPKDFGWYGKGEGEGEGRYAPLKNAETHERFRSDLRRAIAAMLAGRPDEARASMPAQSADRGLRGLPRLDLIDLDGRALRLADDGGELAGKVVAVELWATWCPPCRGTLAWLAELRRRFGDDVAVVTVAVESDAEDVRKLAVETGHPFRWVMGTPEIARAFGDVSAVPTLLLFDRGGRAAGAFYGVPPGLHEQAEAAIQRLTAGAGSEGGV